MSKLALELTLPRLNGLVAVESREDPAKQAQPRFPAPAVRVAAACVGPTASLSREIRPITKYPNASDRRTRFIPHSLAQARSS